MECRICNQDFSSLDGLRRHGSQKHNISSKQTYIDYVLDGIPPICKCGKCDEEPKFMGIHVGFRDYKLGHASRVNNNWGHNPDALKKSHDIQKEMYKTGELKIWNKGLTIDDERVKNNIEKIMSNPERGKNISKALSGVPKTKQHIQNIKNSKKK